MKRTIGMAILALALGGVAAAQNAAPPPMPLFPQQTPEEKAKSDADQAAYAKMPDTEGTGAYAALKEQDPGLPNHVVYRPKDMSKVGKGQLGIVGWGNGGCSADGAGSRLYLAEIASYGYVVVAPGGIHSGPGTTPLPPPPPPAAGPPKFVLQTTAADVKAGIEWVLAENARPGSAYYGKIDPAKLAVAGFSCGGAQAMALASDPRVKTVIMQNSGMFPDGMNFLPGTGVSKATLKTLRTPIIYILGGAKDIAYKNGMDDFSRIDQVPVVAVSNNSDHGGDFLRPNGGPSAHAAVEWLEWQLRGDKKAAAYFVGKDCGICTDKQWTVQRKNLPAQ